MSSNTNLVEESLAAVVGVLEDLKKLRDEIENNRVKFQPEVSLQRIKDMKERVDCLIECYGEITMSDIEKSEDFGAVEKFTKSTKNLVKNIKKGITNGQFEPTMDYIEHTILGVLIFPRLSQLFKHRLN